jgi:uncharacterized protein (TIGR03083 family)
VVRELIEQERAELAGVLGELSAEQWDAPSLCDGWAVRNVVAHLTMPFRYTPEQFGAAMAQAGGDFQRVSDEIAERDGQLPPAVLTAAVADNVGHPWLPPGGEYEHALVHDVIHSLDVTRALGLDRKFPDETMRAVLGVVAGPLSGQHFGTDRSGIEVRAADVGWTAGTGAPLDGPAQDIALLLTGRRVPGSRVSGSGADLFEARQTEARRAAQAG